MTATISPAHLARIEAQGRAVARAAATYRTMKAFAPRYGWPIAICDGAHALPVYGPTDAAFDRAFARFESHPCFDPSNIIGGDNS